MLRVVVPLFFLLPLCLRADLKLQFEISQTTESPSRDPHHAEPSQVKKNYPLTVLLGPDSFMTTDDHESVLTDFAGEKYYVITPATKTYQVYSIYSAIGFRGLELNNRISLEKSLAEDKPKDADANIAMSEHLLSLRDPNGSSLQARHAFPKANFEVSKKPLFSSEKKAHPLSKTDATNFVRFLRYRFPMHPDILAALEGYQQIPDEFDFYRYNVNTTQHFQFFLLTESTVDRVPTPEAATAGFQRAIDGADRLCEAAGSMAAKDYQSRCAKMSQAASNLKSKRPLDSALRCLEYTLSTNERLPAELASFRTDLQNDADVKALLGALDPKNRGEAQKAGEVLHALEAKTTDTIQVLKYYEANCLTIAGEDAQAQRLLTEALAVNPCLVAGWKRLGDNFYNAREVSRAWNCWNAGRHLNASHPAFRSVFELEQKLRTDHPEYF